MEFRPCIDIHNGKVKQIVGGSLEDAGSSAQENFISAHDAAYYAAFYQKAHITGGHVIMLNAKGSVYFEETKKQALSALVAYPGGLQIGGGITAENAKEYIAAGASHVIVTSYAFAGGRIQYNNLEKLVNAVSKEKIVLDLSCRKKEGQYYIVTDRWQTYTDVTVSMQTLQDLSDYCDEFLIHGVDVEGKNSGIEEELLQMLGEWEGKQITYAGGIHSYEDIEKVRELGKGRIHITIGSALDLFGGSLSFDEIVKRVRA